MKILLLHNRYRHQGGEDEVLANERALLKQYEHTVQSVTVNNDVLKNFSEKIRVGLQTSWSRQGYELAQKAVERFQPDIVHVHNFFPLLTPSVFDACFKACVPVVMTLHNYRLICPGALLMRNAAVCEKCITSSAYQAVFHRCYRSSFLATLAVSRMIQYHRRHRTWEKKLDRFIALTEFAREKFIKGGLPSKKIVVKSNFYANETERMIKEKRQRRGVLFIGRLAPEKGAFTLLRAWQNIDIPLIIAGYGPLYEEVKNCCPPSIKLLGQVDPQVVSDLMSSASFLVFPSECFEGFPMVLVEAFANGLPVIASRLGSMTEIVEDGKTGLHFIPGNPEDLRSKVHWMHEHPEKCLQMGLNARHVYEEKYTPERNYEMLMSIYQSAIDEKKENLKNRS